MGGQLAQESLVEGDLPGSPLSPPFWEQFMTLRYEASTDNNTLQEHPPPFNVSLQFISE